MQVVLLLTLAFLCTTSTLHMQISLQKFESQRMRLMRSGQWKAAAELRLRRRKIALATTGQQPLKDFYDLIYVGVVQLGTPVQSFNLVMDTGSADLWVVDANLCTASQCIGKDSTYRKNRYNSSKSTSYQSIGNRYNITYGSGFTYVQTANEKLNLAGVSVARQEFGQAIDIDKEAFGDQPFDGIFGLAWPELSVTGSQPPMQNMAGQLDKPVFTIWLNRTGPAESKAAGQITFGGFDDTHCKSATLNYVKLDRPRYWEFLITGMAVGNTKWNDRELVITDTGTSFILGPDAKIASIAREVGAKFDDDFQLYRISCNAQPPPVTFTIEGKIFSVCYSQYIVDMSKRGSGICVIAFDGMGSVQSPGFPQWILGDPFCRSYCQVHDVGLQRIGFAESTSTEQPCSATKVNAMLMLILCALHISSDQ